jgi:hypothetical protein
VKGELPMKYEMFQKVNVPSYKIYNAIVMAQVEMSGRNYYYIQHTTRGGVKILDCFAEEVIEGVTS